MKKIVCSSCFISLIFTLLLTACSAAKFSQNTSADFAQPVGALEAGNGAWTEEALVETSAVDTAANTSSDFGLFSDAPKAANAPRKLIRTIDLNMETTDFDNLITSIQRTISVMGGYIEESSISGRSIYSGQESTRYASLMVRVPSAKLDDFTTQMRESGNITHRSESVRDVTLDYSDIESHKKSLTIEQERLWELLEKAESVDAIIALESRLSEIRYQLESYESSLRTMDNQVDYSTVNLSIEEVKVFTPTAPDSIPERIQKGFRKNLENICIDFVSLIVWFISSIPLFLIWMVIIAALAIFVRTVWKIIIRIKHKKSQKSDKNNSEDAH